MNRSVTIRLEPDTVALLDRLVERSGRTRSAIVREALRRHLGLIQFEELQRTTLPFAEARGYLTDDDVSRDVS